MLTVERKSVRCAIYTRKSTEGTHDSKLTSCESQREACEQMAAKKQDWIVLPARYDDLGYSGGTIDRPAFQRLLTDINQGMIDAVVVYDFDRLSRSTRDFPIIRELLQEKGVKSYSVTEHYDDMAPHYRDLMLNLKMSIAEFQRTDAAARVTQKFQAMAERGMRTGGNPIVGYDIVNKAWVGNEQERQQAIDQFLIYLETKSLSVAVKRLNSMGYRYKKWVVISGKNKGRLRGGGPYTKNGLSRLLKNPVYIGMTRFNGKLHKGQHEAIIPERLFNEVQAHLKANKVAHNSRTRDKRDFWLRGLVRCVACGSSMTTSFSYNKYGEAYDYFLCSSVNHGGKEKCPVRRVPARQVQEMVYGRLKILGQCPELIERVMRKTRSRADERLPEIERERGRIADELKSLGQKGKNLVEALANEGLAGEPMIVERIKEVRGRREILETRLKELDAEATAVQDKAPATEDVIGGLRAICRVFRELNPAEKKELSALLFREVLYDQKSRQVVLNFYPLPGLPWLELVGGEKFDMRQIWRKGDYTPQTPSVWLKDKFTFKIRSEPNRPKSIIPDFALGGNKTAPTAQFTPVNPLSLAPRKPRKLCSGGAQP